MNWYPGQPTAVGDVMTREDIERYKKRLLEDQNRTGGAMIANGLTTTDGTYTPATGIPDWPEDCQPGYNPGSEYDDPNWGKRDRIDAHKGQRAKAKLRNRKAAKAARKARKK